MYLTNCLAIDVECVGKIKGSQAARVSIVNEYCEEVMDTFVAPTHKVTSYRTPVSGVRRADLINAPNFWDVREHVRATIKGRILVGHSVDKDLKVLRLSHPEWNIRDTSTYPHFVQMNNNKTPSLKLLARRYLGKWIQNGEHSSLEDAAATMQVYKLFEDEWEDWLNEDTSEEEYSEDEDSVEGYYYSSSSSSW